MKRLLIAAALVAATFTAQARTAEECERWSVVAEQMAVTRDAGENKDHALGLAAVRNPWVVRDIPTTVGLADLIYDDRFVSKMKPAGIASELLIVCLEGVK